MSKRLIHLIPVLVLSLVFVGYASAQIVYVDATEGEAGNTALAAVRNGKDCVGFEIDDGYVLEAAPGLPKVQDGYFSLPDGPGLGVILDEDVIAAHPPQGAHFNLFQDDWHKRGKT